MLPHAHGDSIYVRQGRRVMRDSWWRHPVIYRFS